MRISFSHKTVAVYFTPQEKDELRAKWPNARWNARYDPRTRYLTLTPGGNRGSIIHICAGFRSGQVFAVRWERKALPSNGRSFPTFAVINAESQSINHAGVVLKVPEERKRQPAFVVTRNGHAKDEPRPLGILPVNMHNDGVKRLDLLDLLRHHRNKLNELRHRHPEITFKCKPNGDIGIEVLIEE